jgi:hypothetical protein
VKYAFAALVLAAALAASGCGTARKPRAEAYGKTIPADMAVTSAGDIVNNPQAYEGRDVLVAGTITTECPSGGWIWVQDASGQVYVNMHPTNVFIPQKVGARVRAMGKVVIEGGATQVVGYGLEF